MSFTVRYDCYGRLGNALFPYSLCVIYQLLGYKYVDIPQENEIIIDDNNFSEIFNEDRFKNKTLPIIPSNIVFFGYFQHDYIIKYFKEDILDFIKKNPYQKITTQLGSGKTYNNTLLITNYLETLQLDDNDIVVHIRLEDKLTDIETMTDCHCVLSLYDYDKVLSSIKFKNIYWVMNKATTEIEKQYLNYLINKWGGVYKEQTIEEDFFIMRSAKILICSLSTLSWIASAYSLYDQIVYLPKINLVTNWLSFKNIHTHTILYNYTLSTKKDIENILSCSEMTKISSLQEFCS